MAILDTNEMFFTAFEPKQQNRYMMLIDGFPSYMIKGVSAIQMSQEVITLNHVNTRRNIKGKTVWQPVTFTLYDAITPSGAQSIMEWVRLHHESVTGRDGYSDFYKKDLTFHVLGPVGDVVSEWILKGSMISNADFGEYGFDNESTAQQITMTCEIDYAVLNF
jgi:hypothetical protein